MGDLTTVQLQGGSAGISAASQAASQIAGGVAARRQARANADFLEEIGEVNANEERRFNRSIQGAQINASTSNTGSALKIQLSDAVEGEIAALRRQFGFDTAAFAARERGDSALLSSIVSGSGTIIGGFNRILGQNPAEREPAGVTAGVNRGRRSPAASGRLF